MAAEQWFLYLLACAGGRTYTGITTDLQRRFLQHQAGRGAIFTRLNRPERILGAQPFANRTEASKAENQLKRFSRPEKLAWANAWQWAPSGSPTGRDAAESGSTLQS